MQVILCNSYEEVSREAARIVESQILLKPDTVLGLATGSTPIGMYKILAEKYKDGELDFSRVKTFNLDEYYPISRENPKSYYYFMNENLFGSINVAKENINIPNGEAKDAEAECEEYEEKIKNAGGIDLQILGIGQNGHIGFNEPGENLEASTHITELTKSTIKANSRFFNSVDEVPTKALTMGMATILKSRKIILMACGEEKSDALADLLNDDIKTMNPATLLKLHKDVVIICDREAYSKVKPN